MTRQLLVLLPCLALTACIPELTGAPCTTDVHCPSTQRCNAETSKCEVGARVGGGEGGGGGETGGGSGTGGGATGGGTGGGSATGGGTGGGSATGGGTGGGTATGGGGEEVDAGIDTEAPLVIATTPTNGSMAVAIGTSIVITFSEPMDIGSIAYVTFPTVTYRAPSWSNGNTVLLLSPTTPLDFDETYGVAVTGRDVAGNAMTQYSYTFTTEATPDTISPTIVATQPADGGVDVAITSDFLISFSEPMNPASVVLIATPPLNFGTALWADNNTELSISSTAPLTSDEDYSITLTGSDIAGNALAAPTGFMFKTALPPDTTPPTLTASSPTSNATGVFSTTRLALTFSEPMNTNAVVVTVDPDPGLGAATWSMGNARVEFNAPTANWDYSTNYEVDVTAVDLAGNPLAATQIKFTTQAEPDTTPPTVTSTAPATGNTTAPISGNIEFNFSEPMKQVETQAALSSVPAITCAFTWNTARTLMICNPTSNLAANTDYAVTLGVGARDDANLPLQAPFVLNFRTASTPDLTNPSVLSTDPANGAVGVPRATPLNPPIVIRTVPWPIKITFSEAMSQASVQNAFSITSPLGFDGGSFSWSGNTMTYRPPDYFDSGQNVTFQIAAGATDLSGNPLPPLSRTFRVRQRATTKYYNTSTASSLDGYIYANANCTLSSAATGYSVAAGGDRSTTVGLQNIYRGYLTFVLNGVITSRANVDIITAQLYTEQVGCYGSPFSSTFGGAIEAWHVNYGPSLEANDCNPTNLGSRQYVLSTSSAAGARTVNVTAAVNDDWAARASRGNRSQFMIRSATIANDGDTISDYCNFASYNYGTTTLRPYLNVTYDYD